MKISLKIQELIDEVGEQKNNGSRNRILSHLKDAKAHAVMQEVTVPPSLAEKAPYERTTANSMGPAPFGCTCFHGAKNNNCPIHGGKTA
jgi:hypothetical protein